jgi:hypothetical protein
VADLTFTLWGKFRSEHFGVPLPVLPMLHSHLSSGSGTIGPFEAAVPRESVSPHSYN